MKLTRTVLALGLALCLSAPAFAGPQCTVTYPRGFKVPKGTKKRPVWVCPFGDLSTTWGGCIERRRA